MSRRDYKEVIESKLGSKQNIREGKSTENAALKQKLKISLRYLDDFSLSTSSTECLPTTKYQNRLMLGLPIKTIIITTCLKE